VPSIYYIILKDHSNNTRHSGPGAATVSLNDTWGGRGSAKVSRDIFNMKIHHKKPRKRNFLFNKKMSRREGYETISSNITWGGRGFKISPKTVTYYLNE